MGISELLLIFLCCLYPALSQCQMLIYLFVKGRSWGSPFIPSPAQPCVLIDKVDVCAFGLEDTANDGFKKLRGALYDGRKAYVITIGDDGTFNRVWKKIRESGLLDEKLTFGICPFGRVLGNDLATSLGWKNPGFYFQPFDKSGAPTPQYKELVSKWVSASVHSHDTWMATITFRGEDRTVYQLKNGKEVIRKEKELEFPFTNYFSFGRDSEINWKMESRRTEWRGIDFLLYAFYALREWFSSNVRPVTQGLTIQAKHSLLTERGIELKPAKSLMFVNIPRVMGGVKMWRSTISPGLTGLEFEKEVHLRAGIQVMDDKRLEMMSYASIIERTLLRSKAYRLAQSEGPFEIRLSSGADAEYFQVDGVLFRSPGLDCVVIEHARTIRMLKPN